MSKGSKNKTIQENSTIQEYPDGKKGKIALKKKIRTKILIENYYSLI